MPDLGHFRPQICVMIFSINLNQILMKSIASEIMSVRART